MAGAVHDDPHLVSIVQPSDSERGRPNVPNCPSSVNDCVKVSESHARLSQMLCIVDNGRRAVPLLSSAGFALDSKWSHLQRRQLSESRAERVDPLEVEP